MADLTLPQGLYPEVCSFDLRRETVQSRSRFTGAAHVGELMSERWVVSISWPNRPDVAAGAMRVLQNMLAGGVNTLLLHDPSRSVPLGTMRGTPTVQTTAARGALTLVLTVAAGATLKQGDMIGVGFQVFQVAADCDAVGTTLTVPLVNRVRVQINSGAAVTWYRPQARFICQALINPTVNRPGFSEGGALDLEEHF